MSPDARRREGVARPELRIWRPAGPRKGPCFLAVTAGRIGSGFFTPMRNRSLPGRHITDCQVRLYMSFRQTETPLITLPPCLSPAVWNSLTIMPPHFRVGACPYAPREAREQQRQRFSSDPLRGSSASSASYVPVINLFSRSPTAPLSCKPGKSPWALERRCRLQVRTRLFAGGAFIQCRGRALRRDAETAPQAAKRRPGL